MSLLSVRGVYQDGVVQLLEPIDVAGKFKLIVTFVEPVEGNGHEGKEDHDLEKQRESVLSCAGLLSDLTDQEWKVMQEAMRRPLDMFVPVPEDSQ